MSVLLLYPFLVFLLEILLERTDLICVYFLQTLMIKEVGRTLGWIHHPIAVKFEF